MNRMKDITECLNEFANTGHKGFAEELLSVINSDLPKSRKREQCLALINRLLGMCHKFRRSILTLIAIDDYGVRKVLLIEDPRLRREQLRQLTIPERIFVQFYDEELVEDDDAAEPVIRIWERWADFQRKKKVMLPFPVNCQKAFTRLFLQCTGVERVRRREGKRQFWHFTGIRLKRCEGFASVYEH